MADQVKITSLDALESFRASLIVFLTKSHGYVDDVADEVRRTRGWLQNDQRMHWENQVKRWRKILDQAQSELLAAKMSGLRDSTTAQQNAVIKAKRALAEAEEKLRAVKIWTRDFDHLSGPLVRQLEGLRQFLDFDMPKALAFLVNTQRILEAYSDTSAPRSPAAAAPTPEEPPSDLPS